MKKRPVYMTKETCSHVKETCSHDKRDLFTLQKRLTLEDYLRYIGGSPSLPSCLAAAACVCVCVCVCACAYLADVVDLEVRQGTVLVATPSYARLREFSLV
jgi:hypothetical protein